MVGRGDLINQVEVALNQQAQAAAVDLGARVQRQVLVETGLLLVTLLLGVLFAWLVARSMARSLRDLRQGALAVAQYGLPQAVARLRDPALSAHLSPAGVALQIAEPLPVRSKDEFGQVTEAFNAVHLEAVRTAAEQAALRSSVATMFVNLARRSQILVDRLIGHLDRLERGEQDPDRLSELFQLDHLATRMRRNDENLLVLAGADSTRIQREPAALMDVLRAAQSEVEHYTRIEFVVIDQDIEIAAHAVNDLVHLVAELFDNATAFSPPDTSIRVEARRLGDRAVLRVEDRGIGMSPDQYAELNERLATPPMVDVAVSRMMGLVVVARLAARHGVKVELQPAHDRGTVADVLLPSGVLVPRALAGRTHAPSGFPAVRPADRTRAGGRRPARTSGRRWRWRAAQAVAVAAGTTAAADSGAGPLTGLPSTFGPPTAVRTAPHGPSYGPPASGCRVRRSGRLRRPAGGRRRRARRGTHRCRGHAGPGGGNGYGNGGRGTPAWYDLTGAVRTRPTAPATTPTGTDPLPQRRPGGWGEPEPDAGRRCPRQPAGPPGSVRAVRLSPAAYRRWRPDAWLRPAWPPVPGRHAAGAVPAIPAWPPVAGHDAGIHGRGGHDPVPSGVHGEPPAPPASYANDLTMELPIFRELESAWFASGDGPAPERHRRRRGPGGWSTEAAGASAMVGSTRVRRAPAGPTAPADPRVFGGPATRYRGAPLPTTVGGRRRPRSQPQDGGTTDIGLPRRVPMAQLVPGGVETPGRGLGPSHAGLGAWSALGVPPRRTARPWRPWRRLTRHAVVQWQGAGGMTSTQDLGWLLANFADRVPGVAHAVAVSADGLLLASSRDLPARPCRPARRDRLRAGEPDPGRGPVLRGRRGAADGRRDGQRVPLPDVHLGRIVVRRAGVAQLRRRSGGLRDGTARRPGR